MSSLKQEISSAFAGIGQSHLPTSIVSQIAALSTSLRLSPAQLADEWDAYSATKSLAQLDDTTFKGYHTALAKARGSGGSGNNDATSSSSGIKKKKNATVLNTTGLGNRAAAPG